MRAGDGEAAESGWCAVFLIDGGARWPLAAARGPTGSGDRGGTEGHKELVQNATGAALTG
jgi:hypothetical protein